MASATVRISLSARDTLRDLAGQTGETMQTILERAFEEYRRRRFLEEVSVAYAALRQNEAEWEAMKQEQAVWDVTLLDGLDRDEDWLPDDSSNTPARRDG